MIFGWVHMLKVSVLLVYRLLICGLCFGAGVFLLGCEPPKGPMLALEAPRITYVSDRRVQADQQLVLAGTDLLHSSTQLMLGPKLVVMDLANVVSGASGIDTIRVDIPELDPGAYEIILQHDGGKTTLVNLLEVVASRASNFISHEHLADITAEQVQTALGAFGLSATQQALFFRGITLYRLIYSTRETQGTVMTSALVAMPTEALTSDILSIHHGTLTEDADAPSVAAARILANGVGSGTNLSADLSLLLSYYAALGYVVVQADYVGFGASVDRPHPYFIAQRTSASVIAALEATHELVNRLPHTLSGRVFLGGYSQGGYVTLATLRALEQRPIQGLRVPLAIAGAGAYDPEYIFNTIINQPDVPYPHPSFLAYFVYTYVTLADLSLDYADIFSEPYAESIPGFFNKQMSISEIDQALTTDIQALFVPELISGYPDRYPDFKRILASNRLYDNNWRPRTPLRLYHSPEDAAVPYSDSRRAREDLGSDAVTPLGYFYLPAVTLSDLQGSHGEAGIDFFVRMLQEILFFPPESDELPPSQ